MLGKIEEHTAKPLSREEIESHIKHHNELLRFQSNLFQDQCEGALVPVTFLDAARQAIHAINPDHPFLKTPMPSFGVWESQRKENEELLRQLLARK